MTMPPELRAAMAMASDSSVSASLFHRQIAVDVGGGGADDADIDRKRFAKQIFLTADHHQFDQIRLGAGVELATAVARIDEGTQPTRVKGPRLAGGDIAVQMGDHALRQVPGFDLVVHRQRLQLRHQSPVPADDAGLTSLRGRSD